MAVFAVFQVVPRGTKAVREYLGYAESTTNLARLVTENPRGGKYVGVGVASFVREDGTHAQNEYVNFSADKAALDEIKKAGLSKILVDENGNCEIWIKAESDDEREAETSRKRPRM